MALDGILPRLQKSRDGWRHQRPYAAPDGWQTAAMATRGGGDVPAGEKLARRMPARRKLARRVLLSSHSTADVLIIRISQKQVRRILIAWPRNLPK